VSASERHSFELQRHLAVVLKLSSEQAISLNYIHTILEIDIPPVS
jgi:hypothetical protein